MIATVKSLGIDRLPREQRLDLVKEIWDTIAGEQLPPILSQAQRQELMRRMADDDAAPDDVILWDQVKAQTLARLRQS